MELCSLAVAASPPVQARMNEKELSELINAMARFAKQEVDRKEAIEFLIKIGVIKYEDEI